MRVLRGKIQKGRQQGIRFHPGNYCRILVGLLIEISWSRLGSDFTILLKFHQFTCECPLLKMLGQGIVVLTGARGTGLRGWTTATDRKT